MQDERAGIRGGLALFSCADTVGRPQVNAWRSWALVPECSVSIFGDAPGIADQVTRLGFTAIQPVRRNERGRPCLDWIFETMHERATEGVLGYVNSDIILLPGLAESIAAGRAVLDEFLIVSRRWNVDYPHSIEFAPGWDRMLREFVTRHGELCTPYAIDLFVFSRGVCRDLPPFAVGSDYWDNYLVMRARHRRIPVIDVTERVMAVHQNHPLGSFDSHEARRRSPESRRNFVWMGDSYALLGRTSDATHTVVDGRVQPVATPAVTVVVPHRGDVRTLCQCLRAIEHQSYPRSYVDIVVVNNDPHTPLHYLEADFPSLRVLRQDAPGPAAARNTGISCATGDIVALFDSDIVPEAGCVEHAVQILRDQPDCQIVVCRIAPSFARGRVGYLRRAFEWFDAITHYNQRQWLAHARAFATTGLLVRKSAFEQFGYFDEIFAEAASEDWEWATRVVAAGARAEYCAAAVVSHPTVRSLSELRRKKQRYARGDCIYKSAGVQGAYTVRAIAKDEWRELSARLKSACRDPRVPSHYRPGVLLAAVCSSVWTLRQKLRYRHEAQRRVHHRIMARQRRQVPRRGIRWRTPTSQP